jgi:hypothetical protein
MTRNPGFILPALLGMLYTGCGDSVLGGTVGDSGASVVDGSRAATCTGYVAGSRRQPGVSAADYCAVFETACGIGKKPSGQVFYATLDDCLTRYAAESQTGQMCSAGVVCEVEITGNAPCESAAFACGG